MSAADLNLALDDMDVQAVNSPPANGDAGKGRTAVPYDKAIQLYDEVAVAGPAAPGLRPRLAEFR